MTRRVFRALPVGAAPIRWEATIGQGAAQTVPAGLTINPDPEPEPEPPVIQVGWSDGFDTYYEDGPLTEDTALNSAEFVAVDNAGLVVGGSDAIRYGTVVGASTTDIVWHATFTGSGGGENRPDIGAHFSALVVRCPAGSELAIGTYTFTPYIDGVAADSITLELVEE